MLVGENISTCQLSVYGRNSSECYNLQHHFFTFFYIFGTNLILGFPPHCYILWLSLKEMVRGQSVEVFIFNTSLVEVVFDFCLPFVVKLYLFNCDYCDSVTMFFGMLLFVGRPLFLTCICVERYIAILHPVTFLKFKPMGYRIVISVIGWILIISSSLIATLRIVDMFTLLLPEYLIFLIIEVFTCVMVLRALKRPGPGEDVKQRDRVNQDKVKAFRIIQIVLVSSVLTYTPMTISTVLYFILDFNIFLLTWSICTGLSIILGFIQPILYLRRVVKVRICLLDTDLDFCLF